MTTNEIFVVWSEYSVLFWGTKDAVDVFLKNHPWCIQHCEVLTWEEYLLR